MADVRWFYTSPELTIKSVVHDDLEQNMGVRFHVSSTPNKGVTLSVTLRPPGNPDKITDTWFYSMADPILAWRAALIGEAAPTLNYSMLKIYAAAADHIESNLKTYVDALANTIGLEKFRRLRREPVPKHLTDMVVHSTINDLLSGQSQRWTDALNSVEKEVLSVCLKWREDFDDLGLINPRHWHRRDAADNVAKKYDDAFQAVSADFGFRFSGVDPNRLLRQLLLRAEEKSFDQKYGRDLAFGTALHLLRGATHDSLIGISHWLPGRFKSKTPVGSGRVKYYERRLEELTYEWFGRHKR